ncbi:MAG: hypothetical protein CMK74_18510 [Pseudomonadales bacterium]|nr:hypothetical protein [Pseudomonadales bacterium]|tara:strand:- start:450 stop:869 length:420 start_codon:yes stop_codon:yes gene_type:complete
MQVEAIYAFLEQTQGINRWKIKPESDLCNDLGVDGDDFFELEQAFAERFAVNMDSYRWYFHHGEEGWSIGALISPSPRQQVKHIPVTPEVLRQAAVVGYWPIRYPAHEVSDRTLESRINTACLLLMLGLVGLCVLHWLA